jgi:decaprenylphospho-beta-D-erythro-pentofuranosid-2-ulose 2-reductase
MKHLLIIGSNSDIACKIVDIIGNNKNIKISLASKNFENILRNINNLKNQNSKIFPYKFNIEMNETYDNFFNKLHDDIDTLILASGYLENPEVNIEKIISVNFESPRNILDNIFYSNKLKNINKVIVLNSVAADRKNYKETAYALSKFKLSRYLKNLKDDFPNKKIIEIKLGYVDTKMTRNLNLPFFLVSSSRYVAKKIVQNFNNNKEYYYLPFYWKYILKFYNFFK